MKRYSDKTHDKTKSWSALLSPSKADTLQIGALLIRAQAPEAVSPIFEFVEKLSELRMP